MNAKDTYGCIRCGEINGDYHIDERNEKVVCDSCGEGAIITFVTALDSLNDLYLKKEIGIGLDEEFRDEFEEY